MPLKYTSPIKKKENNLLNRNRYATTVLKIFQIIVKIFRKTKKNL